MMKSVACAPAFSPLAAVETAPDRREAVLPPRLAPTFPFEQQSGAPTPAFSPLAVETTPDERDRDELHSVPSLSSEVK
jgi:hypothetical protein